MDFDDDQSDCRIGPRRRCHDSQLNSAVRPTCGAGGFPGARSSNCRSWSGGGPAFSSKCSSRRGQPLRVRHLSPPGYAQLRGNAAALPPFITRSAILADRRMRPTMKHSTSSQRTGHLMISGFSDVRFAVFVLHAARLSELCSGRQAGATTNWGRFRAPNVVGPGR